MSKDVQGTVLPTGGRPRHITHIFSNIAGEDTKTIFFIESTGVVPGADMVPTHVVIRSNLAAVGGRYR